jgi:hypothetical protein
LYAHPSSASNRKLRNRRDPKVEFAFTVRREISQGDAIPLKERVPVSAPRFAGDASAGRRDATAGDDNMPRPVGGGPDVYAKAIADENARMAKAIQAAGLKPE